MELNPGSHSDGDTHNKFESNQLMISPTDIVIAVMGANDTGKSDFIRLFADEGYEAFMGESIKSQSHEIIFVPATLPNGTKLYLIDTPGFSNTSLSDTEVLRTVSAKLSAAYWNDIRLRGVIYIHPISDIGTTAPFMKNLRMFRALCKSNQPSSVVLVTTHWSDTKQQTKIQNERENQLKAGKGMWGAMIEKGSEVFRQDRGRESAAEIIEHLINKRVLVTLEIQSDIVDKHLKLKDTCAGKEIVSALDKKQKEHGAELKKIRQEMELALAQHNQQAQAELNDWRAKLQEKMDQVECNRRRLEADGEALWKQEQVRAETTAGVKKAADEKQIWVEERERQVEERERQAVEKERKLAEERQRQAEKHVEERQVVEKERKLAEDRERQAEERERQAEEREKQAVEKERKLADERQRQAERYAEERKAVEKERKLAEDRERQAEERERQAEERERQAVKKERKLADERQRQAERYVEERKTVEKERKLAEDRERQVEERERQVVVKERKLAEERQRQAERHAEERQVVEKERKLAEDRERQAEERERQAVERERKLAEDRERQAVEKERKLAEERQRQAVEKERKLAEERQTQAVERERQAVEKERKLAEERERQAVENERKLAEERERLAVEKERKLGEEIGRLAVKGGRMPKREEVERRMPRRNE